MDASRIDYMVVHFPGELPTDVLVPQLHTMVEQRAIEILDLAFIEKDARGGVRIVELCDLGDRKAEHFTPLEGEILGLLSDEDLELVAEQVPDGSTAAVLVWEDVATRALKDAVARAGGSVLAHEHVPAHVVTQDLAALQA
jgi:hypothetical protein